MDRSNDRVTVWIFITSLAATCVAAYWQEETVGIINGVSLIPLLLGVSLVLISFVTPILTVFSLRVNDRLPRLSEPITDRKPAEGRLARRVLVLLRLV